MHCSNVYVSSCSIFVGVIGPTYSSEAEVVSKVLSSMPSKYRLPQIGFSTTAASLGSHDLYPNFFRTVPSDDVQIKVDGVT